MASFDDIHAGRLQRLTGNYGRFARHKFDFKVYLFTNVNAFAMADSSIRIYSGLMVMMDDEKLLFVLEHEMDHLVEKHIKKKISFVFAGSAVRKAVASYQNAADEITGSDIIAQHALSVLSTPTRPSQLKRADA